MLIQDMASQAENHTAFVRIMQLLLQTADEEDWVPLEQFVVHVSIAHGLVKPILMVLDRSYDVNLKGENPQTPLLHAVTLGRTEITKILLRHGARQTHALGNDAVKGACLAGDADTLRLILTETTTIDEYGHSLAAGHLLLAAHADFGQARYLEVLKCFCDHGLDLQAANCGARALGFAIEYKHNAVRDYLLAKGVTPESQG
jgi:ankyrin repeat protein